MNILHVMYLYNPDQGTSGMDFYPRTFIFGAKAAAGYIRAKRHQADQQCADVINNDAASTAS